MQKISKSSGIKLLGGIMILVLLFSAASVIIIQAAFAASGSTPTSDNAYRRGKGTVSGVENLLPPVVIPKGK